MLLLPIILWWADSPFRFAFGRSRRIVCALSILAIMAMGALDADNTMADDRHGYEHRGFHESLNEDAFSRKTAEEQPQAEDSVVREGTLIPPTDGRIVMLGRRWAFVPQAVVGAQEDDDPIAIGDDRLRRQDLSTMEWKNRALSSIARSEAASGAERTITRLRFSTGGMFGPVKVVSTRDSQREQRKIASVNEVAEGRHWILAENLMLQRIVESIRADAQDDRWVISGKVTEFFGENRMVIRTAQRSDSE
ncbi:hypothetical protein Pla22_27350 [Rubripirellula amarantea]|uniref:Uncharacterized protein n=1 Tax=Rubripirellula amarantea TaxID=2527999 RepID=A0A5C5WYB8_9BACT|nr:hypothetical protein [Rubripirellula amarantea]TWT55081.1 hypothetical protein Pla22_27350 [Rubripirellula amarantea]